MRIHFPRRRPRKVPLTSLIDVVFILLFFFMLSLQVENHRALSMSLASASIPASSGSEGASASRSVHRLDVETGGYLRFDGERRSLGDIEALMRASPMRVAIVPAVGVPLQDVVDLADLLRPTGAELQLGLP